MGLRVGLNVGLNVGLRVGLNVGYRVGSKYLSKNDVNEKRQIMCVRIVVHSSGKYGMVFKLT